MKVIVMKFILILSNLFFISCYTDTKKKVSTHGKPQLVVLQIMSLMDNMYSILILEK